MTQIAATPINVDTSFDHRLWVGLAFLVAMMLLGASTYLLSVTGTHERSVSSNLFSSAIGTVIGGNGDIQRLSSSYDNWKTLKAGSIIYEGDTLYVGAESQLELDFDDGTIRLDQHSYLRVFRQASALEIELQHGNLIAELRARAQLAIEKNFVMLAREPSRLFMSKSSEGVAVGVGHGSVFAQGKETKVILSVRDRYLVRSKNSTTKLSAL